MIRQQIELMVLEELKDHLSNKYRLIKHMEYREKLKAEIDEFIDARFDADNMDLSPEN